VLLGTFGIRWLDDERYARRDQVVYGEPHMPVSFSIKHAQDFVNAEGELLMNRTRKLYWA
jgi:hypothetical protein